MLNKIIEKLKENNYEYIEVDENTIQLIYGSDIASLKLSNSISISNGSDGTHNLIISTNYPKKETTGTMIKLEEFSFYKYDMDEKPLFTVKGFAMIFEISNRNGFHNNFHITV